MLVSSITFAERANAEDEPIIDETVISSCSVEKVRNGKLGFDSINNTLGSSVANGQSGLVSISCNSSVKVGISQPVQNSASGTTTFIDPGDTLYATAKNIDLGLNITSNGTSSKDISDIEEDGSVGEISVDMEAKKGGIGVISPGEYKFTVTLTVTPF
jgi:hypothetical protein